MSQTENITLDELSEQSLSLNNEGLDAKVAVMDYVAEATEEMTCEAHACSCAVFNENSETENVSVQNSSSDVFKKERKEQNPYQLFLSENEKMETVDAKLQTAIHFMELALAQSGSPNFKSFWDIRTACLQLFKENISGQLRQEMWTKYTELSKEARKLKEILDEESAFAAEQIEIAILALENDLAEKEVKLAEAAPVEFGIIAKSFKDQYDFYEVLQRELNLLNVFASRINALRKELIRTEMRIKIKNKFFQRLSLLGDQIFPQRKELIKTLSDRFSEDITAFIKEYFENGKAEDALFFLREEIKALQGLAKVLTLNTHAFTETRMFLSNCWDKLKVVEKERKKERAEQKAQFKENVDQVLQKIREFSTKFEAEEIDVKQALQDLDAISSFMRGVELGRDEVRYLRDELATAKKPVFEKMKLAEEIRLAEEKERELEKKKAFEDLKAEMDLLLESSASLDAEEIELRRVALVEKMALLKITKFEKNELEKKLKPLRDVISDKKEQAMMSLSDDDKVALEQLTTVLNQRKERRQEIKNQLDLLRKANGSSGFDFEQGMKNNELISEEKERYAKIDQGVKEIETLILNLKRKK